MVLACSASTPAALSASIHSAQSSPPITVTVSLISCSVAGSTVASITVSLLVSTEVVVKGSPMVFSAERTTSPVSGSLRTGEASE